MYESPNAILLGQLCGCMTLFMDRGGITYRPFFADQLNLSDGLAVGMVN